jgi:hypothetical protein
LAPLVLVAYAEMGPGTPVNVGVPQLGIGAGAEHVAPVPEQTPGLWHTLPAGAQTVPAAANPLAGQVKVDPSQCSATSHTPVAARQTWALEIAVQVPFVAPPAAREQAWQSFGSPPPQALAQQTPSAQNPLVQSAFPVHATPIGEPTARTTTLKETWLVFPRASLAEHEIGVLPMGNRLPDGGPVQVVAAAPLT